MEVPRESSISQGHKTGANNIQADTVAEAVDLSMQNGNDSPLTLMQVINDNDVLALNNECQATDKPANETHNSNCTVNTMGKTTESDLDKCTDRERIQTSGRICIVEAGDISELHKFKCRNESMDTRKELSDPESAIILLEHLGKSKVVLTDDEPKSIGLETETDQTTTHYSENYEDMNGSTCSIVASERLEVDNFSSENESIDSQKKLSDQESRTISPEFLDKSKVVLIDDEPNNVGLRIERDEIPAHYSDNNEDMNRSTSSVVARERIGLNKFSNEFESMDSQKEVNNQDSGNDRVMVKFEVDQFPLNNEEHEELLDRNKENSLALRTRTDQILTHDAESTEEMNDHLEMYKQVEIPDSLNNFPECGFVMDSQDKLKENEDIMKGPTYYYSSESLGEAEEEESCRNIYDQSQFAPIIGVEDIKFRENSTNSVLCSGVKKLHLSVLEGDTACMIDLLKKGIDINGLNSLGQTALFLSMDNNFENKSIEIINIFASYGCDFNVIDFNGESLLHIAARSGKLECLKLIYHHMEQFNSTININYKNQSNETALHLAATIGSTECCDFLLAKGSDPLVEDFSSNTPLIRCTLSGSVKCVQTLQSAENDSRSVKGSTTTAFNGALNSGIDFTKISATKNKFPNKHGHNVQSDLNEVDTIDLQLLIEENSALRKRNEILETDKVQADAEKNHWKQQCLMERKKFEALQAVHRSLKSKLASVESSKMEIENTLSNKSEKLQSFEFLKKKEIQIYEEELSVLREKLSLFLEIDTDVVPHTSPYSAEESCVPDRNFKQNNTADDFCLHPVKNTQRNCSNVSDAVNQYFKSSNMESDVEHISYSYEYETHADNDSFYVNSDPKEAAFDQSHIDYSSKYNNEYLTNEYAKRGMADSSNDSVLYDEESALVQTHNLNNDYGFEDSMDIINISQISIQAEYIPDNNDNQFNLDSDTAFADSGQIDKQIAESNSYIEEYIPVESNAPIVSTIAYNNEAYSACNNSTTDIQHKEETNNTTVDAVWNKFFENMGKQALSSPNNVVLQTVLDNNPADLEQYLGSGMSPNLLDEYSRTPLHYACIKGYLAIVNILFFYGAELEVVDKEGNTPLHLASSYGYYDCVKFLLESAASPNPKNRNKNTPLHEAALSGQLRCVQLLIDYGSDSSLKNVNGENAYSYCKSKCSVTYNTVDSAHNDVVRLLGNLESSKQIEKQVSWKIPEVLHNERDSYSQTRSSDEESNEENDEVSAEESAEESSSDDSESSIEATSSHSSETDVNIDKYTGTDENIGINRQIIEEDNEEESQQHGLSAWFKRAAYIVWGSNREVSHYSDTPESTICSAPRPPTDIEIHKSKNLTVSMEKKAYSPLTPPHDVLKAMRTLKLENMRNQVLNAPSDVLRAIEKEKRLDRPGNPNKVKRVAEKKILSHNPYSITSPRNSNAPKKAIFTRYVDTFNQT